jgi:SAM-dependent methyltransferase
VSRYVENVDVDALGVAPGERLVDVGCADGHLAELLERAGLSVVGVEPEAYLRERFAQRIRAAGGAATVVDGSVEALPFDTGSVAAATITEVLEHVPDPAGALRELHRIVRPGGVVCLSVPTSFTERFYWRVHPRYEANSTHLRIFDRRGLERMIRDAGFVIDRWEGRNFAPALSWVFHALLRSESDHAGVIKQHLWVDRVLGLMWAALGRLGLDERAMRLGDRVFPKSWYVYCRKPA